MKIALLMPRLLWEGGADRQFLQLANKLQDKGNKVIVYTTAYDAKNCFPKISLNLDIRTIGTIESPGRGNLFNKISRYVRQVDITEGELTDIKNERFDIINCHNRPMHWLAAYLKKKLCVPVVWMCNDLPEWFLPFLDAKLELISNRGIKASLFGIFSYLCQKIIFPVYDRYQVRNIDKIVVLDKRNRDLIRKVYKKNAVVIHSGLDKDRFRNGQGEKIREKFNIDAGTKLLLCVGLLGPRRRTEDVIAALKLLIDKGHNLKLMVVGGEHHYKGYTSILQRCAKANGMEDRVIFVGSIPDNDLPDYYAACDIFVYPHVNQTWGLAPLEALAAKRPVVVSADTGVAEVLKGDSTSLLFSPKDKEQLSQSIERLLVDNALRERIAEEGYRFVSDSFSWDKYTEQMFAVFQEVKSKSRN